MKGRREMDPINAIKQKREKKSNLLFHLSKNIAYNAQPIAAPSTHKSPDVNFRPSIKEILPFVIIKNTPNKHSANPQIWSLNIFSLKKMDEIKIINIGEEV